MHRPSKRKEKSSAGWASGFLGDCGEVRRFGIACRSLNGEARGALKVRTFGERRDWRFSSTCGENERNFSPHLSI